jgi:hypothetical protein
MCILRIKGKSVSAAEMEKAPMMDAVEAKPLFSIRQTALFGRLFRRISGSLVWLRSFCVGFRTE